MNVTVHVCFVIDPNGNGIQAIKSDLGLIVTMHGMDGSFQTTTVG